MKQADIVALLNHRRPEIRELAIRGIDRLPRETDAEKWLVARGFCAGGDWDWEVADSERFVDLLAWEWYRRPELTVVDNDDLEGELFSAYAFSDGSVIWFTDALWGTALPLSDTTGADAWWYVPGQGFLLRHA